MWSWYWCWYRREESVLFLEASGDMVHSLWQVRSGDIVVSSNALLVSMFTMHYVNRAILYPVQMSRSSQSVPLVVIISAVIFTSLNGYVQCFYLGHIEKLPPLTISNSDLSFQTLLGIVIFIIGMGINIHSDGVLRDLRLQNDDSDTAKQRRYYIPQGTFFTRISCPNFMGEILEWLGFAIASHFSLPSVAFVLYTASNLIPRGVAHHNWYKRKFENYPVDRKWAIIPFVV